jgi:hypothetical protein
MLFTHELIYSCEGCSFLPVMLLQTPVSRAAKPVSR